MRYPVAAVLTAACLLFPVACTANNPTKPATTAMSAATQVATAVSTPAPSPSPTPTASLTPMPSLPASTPSTPVQPLALVDAGLRACVDRTAPYVHQLSPIAQDGVTVNQQLQRDTMSPLARVTIGRNLASLRAINVSVQAITCDAEAADFLALFKAYVQASTDSWEVLGEGVDTQSPALVRQWGQRQQDATALAMRITAIVSALPPQP